MPINEKFKMKLFGMYSQETHGFVGNSDWLMAAKYYRGMVALCKIMQEC